MKPREVHERLKERFNDTVSEWVEPQAGDPFITVAAPRVPEVFRLLRDDPDLSFDFLRLLTAVDWGDRFGVVYHLYSYTHHHEVTLHIDLSKEDPRVASSAAVWATADWLEREAYDMMGIVFEGHPSLRRILLPLDWEGHPLRKDYKEPAEYHGIKHGE